MRTAGPGPPTADPTPYDNPVILANRKAKRLASLLRRQPAITKAKIRLPFVEPAIFLSSSSLSCRLEGLAKSATFQRGRPGTLDDPGIVGALANGITNRSPTTVDAAAGARHRPRPGRGRHPPLQQAPPGGRLPARQAAVRG